MGQRLIVAWDFPKSIFDAQLTLVATVRLWNQEEEVIRLPLERKRDITAFFFPQREEGSDRRILTYRIQVFSGKGELVDTWEHQLWTERIAFESASSADRISTSVSSQPRQESVIETP